MTEEYTQAGFDNSDKKWIAAHLSHPEKPFIYNSADTDWLKAEQFLKEKNIPIVNLCYSELQEILARREAG